jgi:hypothetical protein
LARPILVKWIESIELIDNVRAVDGGEGGYNEDMEYFGELADIRPAAFAGMYGLRLEYDG